MTEPAYSLAPSAAAIVEAFYDRHASPDGDHDALALGLIPDGDAVVSMVDAAFWASLRREEGRSSLVSLAFVSPDQTAQPLMFAHPLPLEPDSLARLAPAVAAPGIHLGVWRNHGELRVWGATRILPDLCFVLEVIEPGLVVLKYRRGVEHGKFGNMAVLRADRLRVVDEGSAYQPGCPSRLSALFASMLDLDAPDDGDSGNALLQLAVSMRSHGRGGALLVVPSDTDAWRESIVHPVSYAIAPAFSRLAELLALPPQERGRAGGRDGVAKLIDMIAGVTAVDGAAIMNDRYELLAFGAKIGRRDGLGQVEQVVVLEPVLDDIPTLMAPVQLGGTRHLSAAQFVHDQRDALALVASQDGRFTVFAWSDTESTVHAHRIETLLF